MVTAKRARRRPAPTPGGRRDERIVRTGDFAVDPSAGWTRVEKEPGDAIFLLSGDAAVSRSRSRLCGVHRASHVGVIGAGRRCRARADIRMDCSSAVLGTRQPLSESFSSRCLIDVLAPRSAASGALPALNLCGLFVHPVWLAGFFAAAGLRFGLHRSHGVYLLTKGPPVVRSRRQRT